MKKVKTAQRSPLSDWLRSRSTAKRMTAFSLAMLLMAASTEAQDCRPQEAAVTSARAALQAARDELRNLQAELAGQNSPAVIKSIQKLIKQLKTGTIPAAERTLQSAESALTACSGAVPLCSEPGPSESNVCSGASCRVDIERGDPAERQRLKIALARAGTTVRLGPGVTLDFTALPACFFPIRIGRNVTLTSVASFPANGVAGGPQFVIPEARSPRSLGPLLKYGPHRDGADTFLQINCLPGEAASDHVRISGFRLHGPSMGQQSTNEAGIRINRCVDVTISNMEIAGWASAGVSVDDFKDPAGRIHDAGQVVVSNSYIHHNQHPSIDGHAAGYGVVTGEGATATIIHNVFDFNRHAIASAGTSEGYAASHNLVLKGGGYHGRFLVPTTHSFDAHGTGASGIGGLAGKNFVFDGNVFQFLTNEAIDIRGKPGLAFFTKNVFAHSEQDDAISLHTEENAEFTRDNRFGIDTFGQYRVCDFDGDGVDDIFLATGQTWWFAGAGKLHWSFLTEAEETLGQLHLVYFDDDARCDVLTERSGQWVVWNGATKAQTPIGAFGVPLAEVKFGRFDPGVRDPRPGVTRQTTHAFRRAPDGQWFVTPLTGPDWQPAQSSSFPLNKLRFGDFTGDGVTDVLAVDHGRWSISDAARGTWRQLNPRLGDDVRGLFIANLDPDDNVDDLLKLDRKIVPKTYPEFWAKLVWWRSKNGTEPWVELKSYSYTFIHTGGEDTVLPVYGFAGRFGAAPGGGTLLIDPFRSGQFFSPAQAQAGGTPEWSSLFAY
jgi:hypothetical protein